MEKRLTRSKTNRKIFGVCGGIGEYFDVDPTIVRILWIIASSCTLGFGIIAYLICAFIVPEE